MAEPVPAPLGYHAMRLRWCRLALASFLRRWGAYILVSALVIGAGSGTPTAAVAGVAGWTVVPLFHAASQGPWLLPALLLQAAAGAACLWAMRPLLWPLAWADAERALPLGAAERRRSDGIVAAIALVPWVLLQAAGAAAAIAARPHWLMPVLGRALAALAAAQALAWAGGLWMLARRRRAGQPALSAGARTSARTGAALPLQAAGWARALLLLPLVRGPARRTGRLLTAASVALCGPGLLLLWRPSALGWWLALLAVTALVAVSRAHALAREEFAPLLAEATVLPVAPARLARARDALCLLPLVPALAMLAAGLATVPLRPGWLAAYLLSCTGSCALQVFTRPEQDSDRSARWLFLLVLSLALASEVAP